MELRQPPSAVPTRVALPRLLTRAVGLGRHLGRARLAPMCICARCGAPGSLVATRVRTFLRARIAPEYECGSRAEASARAVVLCARFVRRWTCPDRIGFGRGSLSGASVLAALLPGSLCDLCLWWLSLRAARGPLPLALFVPVCGSRLCRHWPSALEPQDQVASGPLDPFGIWRS